MFGVQVFKQLWRSSTKSASSLLFKRKNLLNVQQYSFINVRYPSFQSRYQFSTVSSEVEKKISQLNNRFDLLYENKEYENSLKVLQKLIEYKEQHGLDIRFEVQQTGHVLIKNKKVNEGLEVLYDLKSQLEKLGVVDYLVFAKIAENVSKGEMLKSNLKKALETIDESTTILEKNVSFDNPELYDCLARNYAQKATIYSLEKDKVNDFLGELNKAKEVYEKYEELINEQKRSYAIVLQKIANALINENKIELAEQSIQKSKQLWTELEKTGPVDPNHYSTLIGLGVIELYKGRASEAMKIINKCKLDLEKKVKLDKSYTNSYMATITIISGIFKSNSAGKSALEKIKIDFDEGLKILEGSIDDGPTKLLFSEYKQIRDKLFD